MTTVAANQLIEQQLDVDEDTMVRHTTESVQGLPKGVHPSNSPQLRVAKAPARELTYGTVHHEIDKRPTKRRIERLTTESGQGFLKKERGRFIGLPTVIGQGCCIIRPMSKTTRSNGRLRT